jgi:hypothetical protein
MSEWRDISTAPKDGKTFLGWGPYCDEPVTIRWAGPQRGWMASYEGALVIESQTDFGTTYKPADPFTHWMPMPSPPTDSLQEEVEKA